MAKSPTDRPWDAAAVGVKLTELRDKAERGDSIAMVWPSTGGDPARAFARGQASAASVGGGSRKATQEIPQVRHDRRAPHARPWAAAQDRTPMSGLPGSTAPRSKPGSLPWPWSRSAALLCYWVWPPSIEYLYRARRSTHGLDPTPRLADGP